MKRFKNLVSYSLNSIRRYRIRTLVILICLGLSVSVFASIAFMNDGLAKEGEFSLRSAPDLTIQGITAGRQTFVNTSYIYRVQMAAPGSTIVVPRVWGYGNIGNTLVVVVGVDLQNPYIRLNEDYSVESGTFLDVHSNNTVVLGKAVANLLNAKVGNILTILSSSNKVYQYRVLGICDSDSSTYNADMIVMNINDARQFFNVPTDKATDLLVYVNGVDGTTKTSLVNYVARDISGLPDVRVVTKEILVNAQEATYGARSGYFSLLWFVILIAVAIIAFHQTVVVGHESKFEIGLLKSLGFSTSDVIQIRLIEGLILGTIAVTAGIIFGVFYDVVLGAPVLRDFMLGWANLYPGFPVPVYVSAKTVVFTLAIGILPLLFATVIPSWLNATVDPDISMRGAKA